MSKKSGAKTAPLPVKLAKPIDLPPGTKLEVEVVPAEKPPDIWARLQPYAYAILFIVLALAIIMALGWLAPYEYETLEFPQVGVRVTLAYPQFVSHGDEGIIAATVTNTTTQSITGTLTLDLVNSPAVSGVEDSTNTLVFEDLPSGGKYTLHFRYNLTISPSIGGGYLHFKPRVTTTGFGSQEGSDLLRIDIPPIPRLRLIVPGAIALVVGLLWDQIKKQLFPE